jgi:AAA+ superfamily predicted ATPase/ATP-dependent Clp protease adapter protein ClpS
MEETGNKDNKTLYQIVFHNDETTPFQFVSSLIEKLIGVPSYKAEDIARRVSRAGRHAFGPYSSTVAEAIFTTALAEIQTAGHKLVVDLVNLADPDSSGVVVCSFCGITNTAAHKMFSGQHANICDQCVVRSAGHLQELLTSTRFRYTYEMLDWHFGDVSPDKFVKTSRAYPGRVRADLQTALERLLDQNAIRSVGFRQQNGYDKVDLNALWTSGRGAYGVSAISYEELDIGEAQPMRCQINGLWLLMEGESRYAVILSREADYHGSYTIYLEICGPQGEQTASITRSIFDAVEAHIKEAQSYRGKVLSLEQAPHFGGSSTGITVHKIATVQREEIILPEKALVELDRTIIRFCSQRQQLRELGLQTKRGVMFHGPPGTGKTHTIRYLANQLEDHTTFLVTAEQIGLLPEYFALAKLMQPVIFVIEDVDLLAKSREMMHGSQEEALLNHLLNEMDGLKEDADILFILTTNKPEVLEQALITRPGRIDQLIEFPKPDETCRNRLIDLYRGKLNIANTIRDDIAKRTDGVSASFIKELVRRLAQYSIERGDRMIVESEDVDQALNEMLFENNILNRMVLGAAAV